jgi:ubiquitin carboxyl-terminal hydrolase L3
MTEKTWFPLESNPDVINRYVGSLGVALKRIQFHDVLGLDEELLHLIPRPVLAFLFLYPITPQNTKRSEERAQAQRVSGYEAPDSTFYIKQTIGNACGTIAILHALMNNREALGPLAPGSVLETFFDKMAPMTPEQRAAFLEQSDALDSLHGAASHEGATENQDISADIDLHFVAFVHREGMCLELDGRKPFPLAIGSCTEDTFPHVVTATLTSQYIALNPEEVRFNIVAMAPPAE